MEKIFRNPLHIGSLRNVPCPCGSGKKIKKCHGESYALPESEAKAIAQMLVDQSKNNSTKVK
jgi:uncharacterized protein YecA (UPF0149 family)